MGNGGTVTTVCTSKMPAGTTRPSGPSRAPPQYRQRDHYQHLYSHHCSHDARRRRLSATAPSEVAIPCTVSVVLADGGAVTSSERNGVNMNNSSRLAFRHPSRLPHLGVYTGVLIN